MRGSTPGHAPVATLVAMRRALPYLAAAAIGASLLLPFMQLNPQVMGVAGWTESDLVVNGDGDGLPLLVTHLFFPSFWVIGLGFATLLCALVAPRKWHWIAGIVWFGVAVAAVAATWPIRAEVHVLSYAAFGTAALGGLLMVVTSGIEKRV